MRLFLSIWRCAAFGWPPPGAVYAQDKPAVGLIPKAQKPIKLDSKLDEWEGAFVTRAGQ